ncbi:MAG: hypothetical protein AB7N76_19915 [Planctomycetota bacterium]
MFREELVDGRRGFRLELPDSWEVVDEHPAALRAVDRDEGVLWDVCALPWALDTDPAWGEELRLDLARDAQWSFEREFAEWRAEAGPSRGPLDYDQPRTAQGDWSPLVEHELVDAIPGSRADAPGLSFVYRASYRPGNEHVVGRLQVASEEGALQLSAHAISETTGQREAVLSIIAEKQGRGRQPGQAFFDDPRHDEAFAGHVLSRVRRALAWARGAVRVTRPAPYARRGKPVALPETESELVPPPRYRRLPPGALPMAPTIANFTRVGFDLGTTPRMCEVFLVAGERLRPDDREGLRALAVRVGEDWRKEGVTDLSIQTNWSKDRGGRIELAVKLKFSASARMHSAQMWTVDRDGTPFRISCAGPRRVPWKELAEDTARAMRTWRRLG